MRIEPIDTKETTDWQKNRKLAQAGFKDLQYLPKSRTGWNATLAAYAYSTRRKIDRQVDLNQWATMNGAPASALYADLGRRALVFWHGTSAKRAERIAEFGLFHKRGLWATLDPGIAHGYTRSRSRAYAAGSAMIAMVLDRRDVRPGENCDQETESIFRFHSGMPPEAVEYILWDDRIEFVGARKAKDPKPWRVARFKRKEGRWVPISRPPVRFDAGSSYRTFQDWLELSTRRVVSTFGTASAIEVFSTLYSTIDPRDALRHDDVFDVLARVCHTPKQKRKQVKLFSLLPEESDDV